MIYPRTFYVETYGCTFNQADSEKIVKLLLDASFLPASPQHAEFLIINTCAVKSQTEAKILHRIKTIPLDSSQKLLITGCLPWISKDMTDILRHQNSNIRLIFDSNSFSQLLPLLDTLNNSTGVVIQRNMKTIKKSTLLPWINTANQPGIVQITEGCNMNCTYCCTHISRGNVLSYPVDAILLQIQFFIQNGIKELYLTGQDCGLYKWKNYDLLRLVSLIEDNFKEEEIIIRVGMINPINPTKILTLAQFLTGSEIFYKLLHLPIQSASDHVLKRMRRGYSRQMLEELFQNLSKHSITISTDVICGFPEETQEDFLQTYQFLDRFRPDIVNISKFTPRPNTPAKFMKQLDSNVVKSRSMMLTQLYLKYIAEKNQLWKGWEGMALIHGFQPKKPLKYSARSIFYKSIVLENGIINNFIRVKIIASSGQFLIGERIDD